MRVLRLLPELPLLRRELSELSARRTTFVIRGLVVSVLVVLLWRSLYGCVEYLTWRGSAGPAGMRLAGSGLLLLKSFVPWLFVLVWLLMPMMVAMSVSRERVCGTLDLLLLTRLSPSRILLEKLLSRLVPMLLFLLPVSPLLAVAWGFGGVDLWVLALSMLLVVLECVLYGVVGLVCGAWCRTTVGAVLTGFAAGIMLAVVDETWLVRLPLMFSTPSRIWGLMTEQVTKSNFPTSINPASDWMEWLRGCAGGSLPGGILLGAIPALCACLVLFIVARVVWVQRALRQFRVSAVRIPWLGANVWAREFRGAGVLLLVIWLPVFLLCVWLLLDAGNRGTLAGDPGVLWWEVWLLASVLVTVRASVVLSSQRQRGTLDVVLTTPLTSFELIGGVVRGLRDFLLVLCCSLVTMNVTMAWLAAVSDREGGGWGLVLLVLYCGLMVVSTWWGLQFLVWLALLTAGGVRTVSQSLQRSLLGWGLVVCLSWVLLAPEGASGGTIFAGEISYARMGWNAIRMLCRPDGALHTHQGLLQLVAGGGGDQPSALLYSAGGPLRGSSEFGDLVMLALLLSLLQVIWQMCVVRVLRWLVLQSAGRLLGRLDESSLATWADLPGRDWYCLNRRGEVS